MILETEIILDQRFLLATAVRLDQIVNTSRTTARVLLSSRNSLSVILTINFSRHNDSDVLGYALCQLKLVLSVSESELRDVNRTGYPVHRPGSVKRLETPR